jgi:hypothetical protein
MKNPDPLMGAKLKCLFCVFGFKVKKKSKRYQKTQNFMIISNPLLKNASEKSYKQTSLTNMSNSEKSEFQSWF